MELKVNQRKNRVSFIISGTIDKQGAELLEKSFRDLNPSEFQEFVLDFEKVKYIGSSGVRKLLFFYKKMTTNGGKFRLLRRSVPAAKKFSPSSPFLWANSPYLSAWSRFLGCWAR